MSKFKAGDIIRNAWDSDKWISCTGFAYGEIFEVRENGSDFFKDFEYAVPDNIDELILLVGVEFLVNENNFELVD
jgi:hypothetical protein